MDHLPPVFRLSKFGLKVLSLITKILLVGSRSWIVCRFYRKLNLEYVPLTHVKVKEEQILVGKTESWYISTLYAIISIGEYHINASASNDIYCKI